MMYRMKLLILTVLLFIFNFKFLHAQNSQSEETAKTEFNLALTLYESNQYTDAIKLLEKITDSSELTSSTTIAFIFESKSYLQLKNYSKAANIADKFIHDFPGSKYVDEARLIKTKIKLARQEYRSALETLISLIDSTSNSSYSEYAKNSGENIAVNYLTTNQLLQIKNSTAIDSLKPYLLMLVAKSYLSKDKNDDAKNTLEEIINLYPASEEKIEAEKLLNNSISGNQEGSIITTPLIGVMLPVDTTLSGTQSDAGSEILAGIKYAVSKYNKSHENKVGLLIRNTDRNKDKIEQIENEFNNIPLVKAVIGPIYSDEVRYALDAFKDSDIPIISPTATENGLTQIDSNFFQANPSFEVRGKVMAQYIYYVENKRKMSVLNAYEGYSPLLAKAFVKEFEKLGGQILKQENYRSNSFELQQPVSLIAADSLELQGVYLPLADRRDVPAILSQFVQDSLNIPIYGNQDWFLAKGYETSPELSNKLTFTSDYFIDFRDTVYQNFSNDFLKETTIDVNRNVLYGYDITRYLLSVVTNFKVSRQLIKNQLEAKEIMEGYHNNFYFDNDRVNKFLNIVRYRNGKFQLVDKFKSGK